VQNPKLRSVLCAGVHVNGNNLSTARPVIGRIGSCSDPKRIGRARSQFRALSWTSRRAWTRSVRPRWSSSPCRLRRASQVRILVWSRGSSHGWLSWTERTQRR